MTTSKELAMVFRKRGPGRPRKGAVAFEELSFSSDFLAMLATQVESDSHVSFPTPRWRNDPAGFFRDVLGVEPWSRQLSIIEAVRDHRRVAVKSGHKVSKSHTAAGIALWFYCSFDDARVIMTSTTSRQVDQILWRETRMIKARSGRCISCKRKDPDGRTIKTPCPHSGMIDGEIGDLARTGLKSGDFREIVGFTAREAEAVAGISGPNLLYILDEASGIKQEIFDAIEGNRAGGARVIMFSNPTKTSGAFYEAFTEKSKFWSLHTISSEETPNVVYGDDSPHAIPGLAGRDWIEEKKEEWGEESPLYRVRVRGEFAELEEAKIFPVHKISEAEQRFADTPSEGRLFVGLDPAGESGVGDEIAWTLRRGLKAFKVATSIGLTPQAILMHTLGFISEHRRNSREVAIVNIDPEGETGHKVYGVFAAFVSTMASPPFELHTIRASDPAQRVVILYDTMRDELAGNLLDWFNNGGAIPEDAKLSAELNAMRWVEQERTGKIKLVPKKILRKELKRSPDRYDSLALACWESSSIDEKHTKREQANTAQAPSTQTKRFDPYGPSNNGRGGAMDPYGGR